MKKPYESAKVESTDVFWGFPEPTSIADLWTTLVPQYKSRNYGPCLFTAVWDRGIALRIAELSQRRSTSRYVNYVIPEEIRRSKAKLEKSGVSSVRFGAEKPGHGYSGERGDFCLIAGAVTKRHLTAYYRSLELIGGFAYDLTLLAMVESDLGCDWKTITFVTAKAFIFALKGNSNEKLYPKLVKIFKTATQ